MTLTLCNDAKLAKASTENWPNEKVVCDIENACGAIRFRWVWAWIWRNFCKVVWVNRTKGFVRCPFSRTIISLFFRLYNCHNFRIAGSLWTLFWHNDLDAMNRFQHHKIISIFVRWTSFTLIHNAHHQNQDHEDTKTHRKVIEKKVSNLFLCRCQSHKFLSHFHISHTLFSDFSEFFALWIISKYFRSNSSRFRLMSAMFVYAHVMSSFTLINKIERSLADNSLIVTDFLVIYTRLWLTNHCSITFLGCFRENILTPIGFSATFHDNKFFINHLIKFSLEAIMQFSLSRLNPHQSEITFYIKLKIAVFYSHFLWVRYK